MVAEWLWIMYGLDSVTTLARYNKKMLDYSDDGVTLAGAYGPRLKLQDRYLATALRKDPMTRRAVATIWAPNPSLDSKDIPCTVALQFIRRPVGQLNCIVTMRSSDAWLGIPYDIYSFSMIANYLAGALNLEPGWLAMNLGSAHLYGDNLKAARDVIADLSLGQRRSPRLTSFPPPGLLKILEGDDGTGPVGPLPPPWDAYARVLAAPTLGAAAAALPGEDV